MVERIDELGRLRALRACLVVPALEPGMVRAVFLAGGVVTRRTVPRGGGGRLEVEAGLVEVDRRLASELEATEADELLLVAASCGGRRPSCRFFALDRDAILAAVNGVALAA